MYWKKLLNWPKVSEKNKDVFIEGKKINLRNKNKRPKLTKTLSTGIFKRFDARFS